MKETAQAAFSARNSVELSKREYFASLAPHEPQTWFKPTLPARPILPSASFELSQEEFVEWEAVDAGEEPKSDKVKEFCSRYMAARIALDEYDCFAEKARYTQWPAAWADAVLKELCE